jgi:alkanesulfonate monooxygenase SsuD/methylene tetrahydromethanopterin reductase-like flavin-dependent oxidoreductase (luciferase family)
MADLGIQGVPTQAGDVVTFEDYRRLLDGLPPAVTTLWVADHLQFGTDPVFESWTLMTYLAALYPRLRFGTLVMSQSFRNPALLAKMAATFQEVSGGRLTLGLGAGWHEEEYRGYGYDFPRPGVRVAQLAEAIQVMRALWTTSPATFIGEHYRIEDGRCEPRPSTPIRVLVGTNGPKALGVTARHADAWSWDGPWETTFRAPFEVLRGHCEEIGRPISDIALHSYLTISLPDDPVSFRASYQNEEIYPDQIFPIVGPEPADVIREIDLLVDHGVAHVVIHVDSWRTLERFIDEVVPELRLTPD